MPKAKKAKAANVLKAASGVKIQGVSRKNNINVGQVTTAFKKVNTRTATARRALTALRQTIKTTIANEGMKQALLKELNGISKELRPTAKYAVTNGDNNKKLREIYNKITNFSTDLSRKTLKSDFRLEASAKRFSFRIVSTYRDVETGKREVINKMGKIKDVGLKLSEKTDEETGLTSIGVIVEAVADFETDADGNNVEIITGDFLRPDEREWIEGANFYHWFINSSHIEGDRGYPIDAILKKFPRLQYREVYKIIKTTDPKTGDVTEERVKLPVAKDPRGIEDKIKQIYGLKI